MGVHHARFQACHLRLSPSAPGCPQSRILTVSSVRSCSGYPAWIRRHSPAGCYTQLTCCPSSSSTAFTPPPCPEAVGLSPNSSGAEDRIEPTRLVSVPHASVNDTNGVKQRDRGSEYGSGCPTGRLATGGLISAAPRSRIFEIQVHAGQDDIGGFPQSGLGQSLRP